MRLKNKVIIITGSCTGIGKAIAIRAVSEGAKVVVHGLEKEWGEAVVNGLGSDNAVLLIEDITNEGAAQQLVDLAITTFGKLDAIVNNAAIVASSNLHTTDAALLRRVIEVNTIAPFNLIKAALPHLKKQKGSVLNIGSVNAYSGEPNLFAYSVSKGALMTLTHNLGDTLFREEGVRVNQINPGWVLTENETIRKKQHGLAEDWYKDLPAVYAPARRIIWPAEIAAGAVYFLSDESGPVSGQVLTLEQYPSNSRNPPKDTSTIPT
ncbi:MAG: SDR family oxidoreductase [Chitinophagaceae bacterium]|nr:SDR family oxidoreductase [Chitinophagaceae bacterium]